jgi:hypothetical protein
MHRFVVEHIPLLLQIFIWFFPFLIEVPFGFLPRFFGIPVRAIAVRFLLAVEL